MTAINRLLAGGDNMIKTLEENIHSVIGDTTEYQISEINTLEVISLYQERINAFVDKLDKEYQVKLNELLNKYHKLGELQQYSFDFNINIQLRFVSSINFAKSVVVPEKSILKNEDETDEYFLC